MKICLSGKRVPLATVAVLAAGAVAAAPAMAKSTTRYVSPRGKDVKGCARTAPCRTIAYAVSRAKVGDTVDVAPGTYRGTVTVARDVRVVGFGHPTIDARGHSNGILIEGVKSQGSHVTGFVVKNATDEGILATQTSHILIAGNTVTGNDLGARAKNKKGECAAQGPVPGDCGEGLHLMSVFDSVVRNNTVDGNLGGILLTDELGPTHDNLIARNTVDQNVYDCGITVAGHATNAVSSTGQPQPALGGDYRNTIMDNTANGNGTKGFGGGILLAAGGPGSAVYGNTVEHNVANDNGLPGLTLHSHAPGQDLNGNRILDNSFAHDGLTGDSGKPGDVNASMSGTAGILVFSAVTKLAGIQISGNRLANEQYGIWTMNAPTVSQGANTYAKSVGTPLFQK